MGMLLLSVQVHESDQLDQSEVGIHQLLSLVDGGQSEVIPVPIDPDGRECFLRRVKYLRDIPQLILGVQDSVRASVIISEVPRGCP